MSVCIHFLATNPEVQDKLYREVGQAIEEHGTLKLDYSQVQEMKYLDQVVHETLRLYPLTVIERKCSKDYKLPGYDFIVPKGKE